MFSKCVLNVCLLSLACGWFDADNSGARQPHSRTVYYRRVSVMHLLKSPWFRKWDCDDVWSMSCRTEKAADPMHPIDSSLQLEASAARLNLPKVSIYFIFGIISNYFFHLLLFFSFPQEGAGFYDIDNEEYEAMSVEVRLLPRKLRFFCSAERKEQLAQALWGLSCRLCKRVDSMKTPEPFTMSEMLGTVFNTTRNWTTQSSLWCLKKG